MIPQLPPEWLAYEYRDGHAHKLADVPRATAGLSTLHEATGGDPSSCEHFTQFIQPYGGEQELFLALRSKAGGTWGVLALYRAPGQPEFSQEERDLLRALAPHLTEGARRGLLVGEAQDPDGPESPGLVVLSDKLEPDSLTPGVERWLDQLPGRAGELPPAVVSVAAHTPRVQLRRSRRGRIRPRALDFRALDRAPRAAMDAGSTPRRSRLPRSSTSPRTPSSST